MNVGRNKIKCNTCNNEILDFKYLPMKEWNISGNLCSKCYSEYLTQYYRHPEEKGKTK